jgi:hypothetical protein
MLGILYVADEQAAIDAAIREFQIEPQHQGRLVAPRHD